MGEHDGQAHATDATASGNDPHGECSSPFEVVSDHCIRRLNAKGDRQTEEDSLREVLLPYSLRLRERKAKKRRRAANSTHNIKVL